MATAQRLSARIPSEGPSAFYSEDFKTMMEPHIPLLVAGENTQLTPIEPGLALQYANDFYGLLLTLGIPSQYHWTIMRCNGYDYPMEFKDTITQVIVPPLGEIDDLQKIWSSTNNLMIG